MRRFIRFMGEQELEKFLRGDKLVNKTKHNGRVGDSEGFCFFDAEEIDPITAHHMLTGIATLEYMVEFLVSEDVFKKCLRKSKGFYHMPGTSLGRGEVKTEYCTTSYNRGDFLPYQIWHLMISYPVMTPQSAADSSLSLCESCWCMTKTIDGKCGKCEAVKNHNKSKGDNQ